ncbi:FGGY family carbohydrate kinase [Microbacterium paraoxydans]|uniref:FGGY family carbohydrate kinase n=1 Tax=Microbacterium paraoxydans TaxID=199592 RepID=UPI001CFA3BA5|nr:FGGY family carbohydrate kinase [Microbacterium paraoxydans]
MELVAGIDSSTQSCKVVIADVESGAVVREGRALHPAGTEVDPEDWWRALQDALAAAGGLDDVRAWAISGQQHGMVALDGEGRVVRPALLWNDMRSADAAAALIAQYGAEALARRTGLVPVPSFTLTKVRWLRENEPEHARRVGAVALPHDWLTWRLRGYGPGAPLGPDLDELVTDRSEASGTGYWTDEGYDRDLFGDALGRDAILPRVLSHDAVVHDAEGRSVGPGSGDNAGAALGLGAQVGDVVVSIGTSGTVFATSSHRTIDPTGTVAGFADAAGGHLPLVATLSAARVFDTVAALLGVDHEGLSVLALAAAPGAGGLVLEPYLEGERTPNLPDATGTLFGLTLASTTRENLARSAYEGVFGGLLYGLNAIRELGVPTDRGILIGGGARSAAVRAIAPEILDIPMTAPPPGEFVAWGMARQAARTIGRELPPAA